MTNLLHCLEKRGLLEAATQENLHEIFEKPTKIYLGFDPTADSLHLGHLVGIVILAWCQKFGHTPYVLIGGATGRVGDPSGKSVERPLLLDEEIRKNVASIRKHFDTMLDFSNVKAKPEIVNNDTWLSPLHFLDFLRDVGKHFRVGNMLAKESVRSRINSEEGMSFTEFSYQILQAYDFYHLFKEKGVCVEFGGSDQWGNIVSGIDLIRKLCGKQVFGVTFPLLTRSDGKKFGKTESGAVWLSPDKLSPYQFYQYLITIPDADVTKMMRMLTFMELDEIAEYERQMQKADYIPNTAQRRLAEELTRFVHGEDGLQAAQRATQAAMPGSKAVLDASVLEEVIKDMPSCEMSFEEVIGKKFVDIIVKVDLLPSKAEVLRMMKNGGMLLNNNKIEDPQRVIEKEDLVGGQYLLLGVGKKKKLLLHVKKL